MHARGPASATSSLAGPGSTGPASCSSPAAAPACVAAAGARGRRRPPGVGRDPPVVVATADLAPGDPLAGASDGPRPAGADDPGGRPGDVARPAPSPASTSPPARSSSDADVAATAAPRALIPPGWSAVAVGRAGRRRASSPATPSRAVARGRRARRRRRRRRRTAATPSSSPCPTRADAPATSASGRADARRELDVCLPVTRGSGDVAVRRSAPASGDDDEHDDAERRPGRSRTA